MNRHGSYLRHSPRLRHLNHLVDSSQISNPRRPCDGLSILDARHRITKTGNRSPSQVSHELRSNGHVASRCYPANDCRLPQAPAQAKFPGLRPDFGGPKVEAPPLPADNHLSRFGTVSVATHRQGLPPLSWLSYSSPGISPGRRAVSLARSRMSPCGNSPRRLGRTNLTGLPPDLNARSALWSEPPRQDFHPL